MEEQDFINATDLRCIQAAKHFLMQIVPENSKIVDSERRRDMLRTLSQWEEELYSACRINVL